MSVSLESILLEHSSGILLLVDPVSLAICEVSKPTLLLLGYRREELLGQPITKIECSLADTHFWEEVLHGRPVEAHGAEGSYLCASGDILSANQTVTRVAVDGRTWLVVRAEPFDHAHGIENELASVASLLRATLEATADGILLIDRTGAIVNMNRQFSRMWGLPDDILIEHEDGKIFSFMAGLFSDPNAFRACLADIAPDGEDETSALLQLADGRFLECRSMPARQGAHISGRVFSFIDVTERKRLEQALLAQTERLLIGQRSAGMVIMDWDIAKDELSWSDSPEWLRGPLPEGEQYSSFVDQIHPEDRDRFQAMRRSAIDTLQPQKHEYRIVRTDGRMLWVRAQSAVLPDATGKAKRMVVAQQDITESKQAEARQVQLEAQLRESQKMEALGTLAGGVAHDFNNIVTTIMGNVELARQDVGAGHAALESLEEIRKASRRAKDLVRQILAFSRRQVIERQVISLLPVVEESVRLLRSTLPAGVNLSASCAPDAPTVLADATQVEQVLLNLCANAWQAMQGQERPAAIDVSLTSHLANGAAYKGPERRLRNGRIALAPGRYACLTVRDTGPGMDQATRSRIFEPFFTTKPVGKGTGLGLAVVHGIVQDHGASIAVNSAPGEGATFRIYFPAAEVPAASAAVRAAQSAPVHGQGKHILFVDDDEGVVFLMARLLERQGYRVSAYTEAHAAVEAVRADPEAFDLVVTDYNMPGMSGLDVARVLREVRADLPLALASGYITEELRVEALAAGVNGLIFKPSTAEKLCEMVARLANTEHGKENDS